MTLLEALTRRNATLERRLAAKYPPIKVRFPDDLKPKVVAAIQDEMRHIQELATPPVKVNP